MEFKAPRGTSDHLPDLKANWNKIEIIARETAKSFGYNEITTPVFEQTGLFNLLSNITDSSGNTTALTYKPLTDSTLYTR